MNKEYFKLNENGILYYLKDENKVEVTVQKCFPWSSPDSFISLRDKNNKEVLMIDEVDSLSIKDAHVIRNYITMTEFVLKIIEIKSIEENFGLREFQVLTKSGKRSFQTKLDEWPILREDGSVIIKDLSGDIFKIYSFESLGEASKKVLSPYVN